MICCVQCCFTFPSYPGKSKRPFLTSDSCSMAFWAHTAEKWTALFTRFSFAIHLLSARVERRQKQDIWPHQIKGNIVQIECRHTMRPQRLQSTPTPPPSCPSRRTMMPLRFRTLMTSPGILARRCLPSAKSVNLSQAEQMLKERLEGRSHPSMLVLELCSVICDVTTNCLPALVKFQRLQA